MATHKPINPSAALALGALAPVALGSRGGFFKLTGRIKPVVNTLAIALY
jgi:hypothetical protein